MESDYLVTDFSLCNLYSALLCTLQSALDQLILQPMFYKIYPVPLYFLETLHRPLLPTSESLMCWKHSYSVQWRLSASTRGVIRLLQGWCRSLLFYRSRGLIIRDSLSGCVAQYKHTRDTFVLLSEANTTGWWYTASSRFILHWSRCWLFLLSIAVQWRRSNKLEAHIRSGPILEERSPAPLLFPLWQMWDQTK